MRALRRQPPPECRWSCIGSSFWMHYRDNASFICSPWSLVILSFHPPMSRLYLSVRLVCFSKPGDSIKTSSYTVFIEEAIAPITGCHTLLFETQFAICQRNTCPDPISGKTPSRIGNKNIFSSLQGPCLSLSSLNPCPALRLCLDYAERCERQRSKQYWGQINPWLFIQIPNGQTPAKSFWRVINIKLIEKSCLPLLQATNLNQNQSCLISP